MLHKYFLNVCTKIARLCGACIRVCEYVICACMCECIRASLVCMCVCIRMRVIRVRCGVRMYVCLCVLGCVCV